MTRAPIPPELRARLHGRFPKSPLWAPVEPAPSPWEVIRNALVTGRDHGLNETETAVGIYGVLVARGLITEGRV